jgi:hypothetical protein
MMSLADWVEKQDQEFMRKIEELETELERVKGELVVANAGWDASQNSIKYHIEENERLQNASWAFCVGLLTGHYFDDTTGNDLVGMLENAGFKRGDRVLKDRS